MWFCGSVHRMGCLYYQAWTGETPLPWADTPPLGRHPPTGQTHSSWGDTPPLGRHPPPPTGQTHSSWGDTPGQTPPRQTPPPPTATAADGMHSCYWMHQIQWIMTKSEIGMFTESIAYLATNTFPAIEFSGQVSTAAIKRPGKGGRETWNLCRRQRLGEGHGLLGHPGSATDLLPWNTLNRYLTIQ